MSKTNTKDFFKQKKEWSLIKDALLHNYLVPYSSKIFNTHKDIVYIDAFAGKGKFDDGNLGSPIIAYQIFKKTENTKNSTNKVNFIFIENEFYEDLKRNTIGYVDCEIISDNYENVIENILKKQTGKNVFLYVDPYGIKSIKMSFFKIANSQNFYSSELLLNFNSFGFIREGCRLLGLNTDFENCDDSNFLENVQLVDDEKNSIDNMNKIAGGNYWQIILKKKKNNEIDKYEAEKMFSKEYCKKLKENTNYKYVINLPIREKQNNHPKYRMIFATNHIDGFILMVKSMCKRNEEMINKQNKGIQTLFEETVDYEIIDSSKIENIIMESLVYEKEKNLNNIYIDIIEEIGIYSIPKINEIISNLEKDGKLAIKRIPAFTKTGKPSKFMSESQNKQVLIVKQ